MKQYTIKMRQVISFALAILLLFSLVGCGSAKKNMRDTLPGEWFVWHWYYVEGESGFYDNAVFYTFTEDGHLTIKENVEGAEAIEATYVWDNDYTIIVSYPDGSSETFEITPHKYDGRDELKYTNVDTGLILSMENITDWTDD